MADTLAGRLATLPNLLTASRILAAPVLAASVLKGQAPLVDATLVFAAGVTDALDGMLARLRGETSDFGEALDPIADKIFIVTGLFLLVGDGSIRGVSVWAVLIIVWRELLISGLRDHGRVLGLALAVSKLAKAKTVAQFSCLIILFAARIPTIGSQNLSLCGTGCLWLAAGLTLYTGVDYLWRASRTAWK